MLTTPSWPPPSSHGPQPLPRTSTRLGCACRPLLRNSPAGAADVSPALPRRQLTARRHWRLVDALAGAFGSGAHSSWSPAGRGGGGSDSVHNCIRANHASCQFREFFHGRFPERSPTPSGGAGAPAVLMAVSRRSPGWRRVAFRRVAVDGGRPRPCRSVSITRRPTRAGGPETSASRRASRPASEPLTGEIPSPAGGEGFDQPNAPRRALPRAGQIIERYSGRPAMLVRSSAARPAALGLWCRPRLPGIRDGERPHLDQGDGERSWRHSSSRSPASRPGWPRNPACWATRGPSFPVQTPPGAGVD